LYGTGGQKKLLLIMGIGMVRVISGGVGKCKKTVNGSFTICPG
jgi:hypothetical protein